jgi:ribosomal protein S27E
MASGTGSEPPASPTRKRVVGVGWGALLLALLAVACLGCAARTRRAAAAEGAAVVQCENCGKIIAANPAAGSFGSPRFPSRRRTELGLCFACAEKQARFRTITIVTCPRCGRELGRTESLQTVRRGDVTRTEWSLRKRVVTTAAPSPCARCNLAAAREAVFEREADQAEMRAPRGWPCAISISSIQRLDTCAGQPTGPGREFILIHLWVENRGLRTFALSPDDAMVITKLERRYRPDPVTSALAGGLRSADLPPGRRVHGWIAFRTLRGDPPIILFHQNPPRFSRRGFEQPIKRLVLP